MQQAANEIGIPEPSLLFGAADDTTKQLLALAQREGKEFSETKGDSGGWTALHKEYTFNTVNGQKDYALPADFQYFVNRTFWDNAFKWELLGPITAQEKQILRYGVIASGPRRKFYVMAGKIYLEPTPEVDGEMIAFDYYSDQWCKSAGGTGQNQWQADTDTYVLDEDMFIKGIKWRYLRAKGLDYSQEYADYLADMNKVVGRDGGARDLPLAGGTFGTHFLGYENIPETGYGS